MAESDQIDRTEKQEEVTVPLREYVLIPKKEAIELLKQIMGLQRKLRIFVKD